MSLALNKPKFSINKGNCFGQISGGKYDGRVLFVDTDNPNDSETVKNDFQDIQEALRYATSGKRISSRDYNLLIKHLQEKSVPVDDKMKEIYFNAMGQLDKKMMTDITIHDGIITPVASITHRDTIYISGPSGSGKSTWIKMYAEAFHKLFPDRPIYLFSKVRDDPAFQKMLAKKIMTRIELDEELVQRQIKADDLKNSLAIFDDIDTVCEKNIKDCVYRTIDDIYQTGRHSNTYIIRTSHQMANYRATAITFTEASQLVVFPHAGMKHTISYVLQAYVGLSKADIARIMELKSRWVSVHKNYPNFVSYETGAYFI